MLSMKIMYRKIAIVMLLSRLLSVAEEWNTSEIKIITIKNKEFFFLYNTHMHTPSNIENILGKGRKKLECNVIENMEIYYFDIRNAH